MPVQKKSGKLIEGTSYLKKQNDRQILGSCQRADTYDNSDTYYNQNSDTYYHQNL